MTHGRINPQEEVESSEVVTDTASPLPVYGGQTYSKSSKPTASKVVAASSRSPLSAARHIVMYSGR